MLNLVCGKIRYPSGTSQTVMGKASGPHESSPGVIVLRVFYSNLGGITNGKHQSLCNPVSKAGICVCRGKITLHSVHHNISCAAGCLVSGKTIGKFGVHNSKFRAGAVVPVGTFHHTIFNGENHRRRHFRACGSDCKNNANGQVFICFNTTVKQIFHFKIIGDSVTDSLCCINYAAASNWQKEVNTFRPSNADPFFYQGKARIGNHATKVYIGKSGSIQALMYTFQ